MFLAVDRVSKFATVEMATRAAFIFGVITAFPYQIRRVVAYLVVKPPARLCDQACLVVSQGLAHPIGLPLYKMRLV